MTISERNNKLKYFIACLKCEVSGKSCDVNCSTQYDAGTMGEIIENLEAISKALEQEPKTGYWNTYELAQGGIDEEWLECSECMWSNALSIPRKYCPNCGTKMEVKDNG